jgi:hypothetical protein
LGHRQDLDDWHSFAARRGIMPPNYNPPMDRLLPSLGFECAPIAFWSFQSFAFLSGSVCALIWGPFMYFFIGQGSSTSTTFCAAAAMAIGTGVPIGLHQRYRMKKLGLTNWEQFKKDTLRKAS